MRGTDGPYLGTHASPLLTEVGDSSPVVRLGLIAALVSRTTDTQRHRALFKSSNKVEAAAFDLKPLFQL